MCASNLLSTSLQHGATYPHCRVHLVGTFPLHVLLHLTSYIVVPLSSGSVVAAVHFSDFNLTQHVPRHGCLPAGKQANLSNAVTATRVRYTTHMSRWLDSTLYTDSATYIQYANAGIFIFTMLQDDAMQVQHHI